MIWLSLKTYREASDDNAVKLAEIMKSVSAKFKVPIIPCVQPMDIYKIKKDVEIEVWAQHIDPIDPGRHFGWISPYSIKKAGATGTVINHAERSVDMKTIKDTLDSAKRYSLKTLVICETQEQAITVSSWKPDYVAYEHGRLIAGPKSMIDEDEKGVKHLAKVIPQPLIVGAGITSARHVRKTLRAGGAGVILASAVVKAKNPRVKLTELARAFK